MNQFPTTPAPPEPREPEAREAVEAEAMKFIIERGWEDDNYGVARVAADFALAYSAELRAERDKYRDESEFFQREMDNFRRNRDHRIVQLEAELAASRANHIDANELNMKAEQSLLQARLDLKTKLERALADAKDINGYATMDDEGRAVAILKVMGHTTGMIIRLERELASTSAPEGT